MQPNLHIYTDGSILRRIGGWAFCVSLEENGRKIERAYYGSREGVTGNQMELLAVIMALHFVKGVADTTKLVRIYSDSQYVVDTLYYGRINYWRANGWLTAAQTPVKNQDYWNELDAVANFLKMKGVKIEYIWVRGHRGTYLNEYADRLAYVARVNQQNCYGRLPDNILVG